MNINNNSTGSFNFGNKSATDLVDEIENIEKLLARAFRGLGKSDSGDIGGGSPSGTQQQHPHKPHHKATAQGGGGNGGGYDGGDIGGPGSGQQGQQNPLPPVSSVQQPPGSNQQPPSSSQPPAVNPPSSTTTNPGSTTTGSPTTSSPTTSGTTTAQFNPATMINAANYGAVGDGKTDNTAALNNAANAAAQQGKTLWIPPGVYDHSGVITANGCSIQGAGSSTQLYATNPNEAAIKLTGNNASLSGVKTLVEAPDRSSQPDAAAVLVQNATNAKVSNVITQGAASNGIRLDRATNCSITNSLVTGSNADGIALMNGSCNNKITNCVADQTGDDAFSSDSYNGDAIQNSGNVFDNCLAENNNNWGRSFALMGSKGDTVENSFVQNTPAHAVIVAGTDSNSGTMAGSGAILQNNKVNSGTPSVASILGFDPGLILPTQAYTSYVGGTGPGANNTAGNRS